MTTQFKLATGFRKSLEARLKKLANTTGQDLQRLRRKVAFEWEDSISFKGWVCNGITLR
ncbi:MAG: hypothetical protein S4CHLAM45_06530 [Chlamydiales bacterium]|nr:hypothetical protein [Chlamydiales bacterium]MCH9620324.1 hypothetical protein [Chlamydiales bacterium]MCH9622765.1 hypothetical protein [Chlamydiales bacterium]